MKTAVFYVTRPILARRMFIVNCDLFDETPDIRERFAAKLQEMEYFACNDSPAGRYVSAQIEAVAYWTHNDMAALRVTLHYKNGAHISNSAIHSTTAIVLQSVLGNGTQLNSYGIVDDHWLNPLDSTLIARAS